MNVTQIVGLVLAASVLLLSCSVYDHSRTGRYVRTTDGLLFDSRTGEVWAGLKLTPAIREEVGWDLPQRRAWIRTVAPLAAAMENEKLATARPSVDAD